MSKRTKFVATIVFIIFGIVFHGCGGGGGSGGSGSVGGSSSGILGEWAGSIENYDLVITIEQHSGYSFFGKMTSSNPCFVASIMSGSLVEDQIKLSSLYTRTTSYAYIIITGVLSGNTITGSALVYGICNQKSFRIEGDIVLTH